jgi:hypothetical protein
MGHVLDILVGSSVSVYVSNNGMLCVDVDLSWGRRSDSLVEFNHTKVEGIL